MLKKWFISLAFTSLVISAYAQKTTADSAASARISAIDTSIMDYDEIFTDFDAFMDSILSPHSYFLASLSAGKGYYNFETKGSAAIETSRKLTYSPTLGYYHKSGLGITGTGYVVHENEGMNFYQAAITPSFDYLKNHSIATGISFTKFFTKDSLSFYTTPLQNEVYAYFTYRGLWMKPGISMSYGWGSRTDYSKRESIIQDLRLRRNGFTYINTKETIGDFSITASMRHDFYWLDVLASKDHIRITPQFSFTSGTQKFGFNQSSNTYGTTIRTGNNVLYSTDNVYLDDELRFQPLSLTFHLRTEYAIGKFFAQPQFMADYYFPATTNKLTALFLMNLGLIF